MDESRMGKLTRMSYRSDRMGEKGSSIWDAYKVLFILRFAVQECKWDCEYWGSSVAITSLQYTRPHQDIMRLFVCSVCEREKSAHQMTFFFFFWGVMTYSEGAVLWIWGNIRMQRGAVCVRELNRKQQQNRILLSLPSMSP